MTREITVTTPENVTITYDLAGLGSRSAACLADLALQVAVSVIVALMVILIMTSFFAHTAGSPLTRVTSDVTVAILVGVLGFVGISGYFIYFETRWNGQTPGKRLLGLRVVREEGGPIDFSSALIRNLIRVIDLGTGVAFISILVSPHYKRLGDYAAGTIVIKERTPDVKAPAAPQSPRARPAAAEASLVRDVDLLTRDEVAAVRRFVERRWQLARNVQEDVARQIAEPIMARLSVPKPTGPFSYANFLDEVYNRCVEERGSL